MGTVSTVEPHDLTAVGPLVSWRNPPKPVPLRQGFGGHPLRTPPRLDSRGFLRRRVNAQLRHAVSNWLYVTHQTQSQAFNARCNNPAHRFIGQAINPRSEFGKRFDQAHNKS